MRVVAYAQHTGLDKGLERQLGVGFGDLNYTDAISVANSQLTIKPLKVNIHCEKFQCI